MKKVVYICILFFIILKSAYPETPLDIFKKQKNMYEVELQKCANKDIVALLKIYTFLTKDYQAAINILDRNIKKPEYREVYIEKVKADIYIILKKTPISQYISEQKNQQLKKKSIQTVNSLNELIELCSDNYMFWNYKKEITDLKMDLEKIISTKGSDEKKLSELRNVANSIQYLINKVRIDKICYYEIERPYYFFSSQNSSEYFIDTFNQRFKIYKYNIEKCNNFKYINQKNKKNLIVLLNKVQDLINNNLISFAIDYYFDFLATFNCENYIDADLSERTKQFIVYFLKRYYSNKAFGLIINKKIKQCDEHLNSKERLSVPNIDYKSIFNSANQLSTGYNDLFSKIAYLEKKDDFNNHLQSEFKLKNFKGKSVAYIFTKYFYYSYSSLIKNQHMLFNAYSNFRNKSYTIFPSIMPVPDNADPHKFFIIIEPRDRSRWIFFMEYDPDNKTSTCISIKTPHYILTDKNDIEEFFNKLGIHKENK